MAMFVEKRWIGETNHAIEMDMIKARGMASRQAGGAICEVVAERQGRSNLEEDETRRENPRQSETGQTGFFPMSRRCEGIVSYKGGGLLTVL